MDYLNIFFPYMSAEQLKVMEETPKANEDLPEFNHEINEVVSTLFPPDEVTGNPTNAVSKLLSPKEYTDIIVFDIFSSLYSF